MWLVIKIKKSMLRILPTILFVLCIGSLNSQNPFQRKGDPKVTFSLQSYSFSKLLNDKIKGRGEGLSLEGLLEFAASQNFDAVDLTGYYFPGYPEVPSDDYIYFIKRKAFLLGLEISGTGVRNDFAANDPLKREEDVQHVKDWIEVASKLGAPVVRIFAGQIPEDYEGEHDLLIKRVAECIKECADYAEEKGVFIGVQNHGNILLNAEQTLQLIKEVDSKWFGIITDTGYFVTKDPYKDWEKLLPYTINFLLKEHLMDSQNTPIDVKKTMSLLKNNSYRGYVVLETLSDKGKKKSGNKSSSKYDPFQAVPSFFKEVKNASEAIDIYKK